MQPTTMPTTVRARNVVMGSCQSLLAEVGPVTPIAGWGAVEAGELPTVDLGEDVAVGRALAGGVAGGEEPVVVELVGGAQGGEEAGACRPWPRGLEGLHEEPGRRPPGQRGG